MTAMTPLANTPTPRSYRAHDGATLYFQTVGRGAPVITIGGGAPRDPEYLGDLAGLAHDAQLVIPYLRGVGPSPASGGPEASWWHQAEDIEALCDHLGLERVIIIAHSAGTRVAIAFAAQHPERVGRMLLITPPAGYLVSESSDTADIADRRRDELFRRASARLADVFDDQNSMDEWIRDTAPAGYAAWTSEEQRHAALNGGTIEVHRAFFQSYWPPDLAHRLGAVTASVLVVAGAEDALTGVTQARALAALFPQGACSVLEDCGHYPWVEVPHEFLAAARPFLLDPDHSEAASLEP